MPETIESRVGDGVGTLTLSRYEKRNALNGQLFTEMADQLEAWREDDSVAAVVITGGEEVFSAGLDLDTHALFTEESRKEYTEICRRIYGGLLDYPKATIAACAGPTLGGGCDIAVFSDIRIASEGARFGYPQIKLGLTPFFSPLWKIVGLSQAKLLTLSGELIHAHEALRIGLVDRLVPRGEVVETATELARSIAATTVDSVLMNKGMALRSPAMDPISAFAFEMECYRVVTSQPAVIERVTEGLARVRGRA
ncbi:MAG TPA: enoyl-CoA hydratase/isomerase family protein [Solirubrobacteraceae bacterium]|jgi:enoyl-CoA hydratase/carnithine racemase|nr:enoyl-CoA hydratase/isomerase family protein [Solirubrobacteraceae bacterium]